jgi:hypothetical protein
MMSQNSLVDHCSDQEKIQIVQTSKSQISRVIKILNR